MITPRPETTIPKTEQVRAMFDGIAPRYDLLNHLLSLGVDRCWRRRLVRSVQRRQPARLLDVATGTGDLALALARALPRISITGTDLSAGMLAVARTKAGKAGIDLPWVEADVMALPFPDDSFEAVTAAFGVRNFEDLSGGLEQMRRVMTPGGGLWILEFSTPHGPWGALFRLYFHRVLPLVGRLVSRDPRAYRYLPESVEAFPDGEKFLSLLHRAGFQQPKQQRIMGGVATLYTASK